MANVKPGDRAVVVGGSSPNRGKIVLVIEEAFDNDVIPTREGPAGVLKTEGQLGWWCESLGSDFVFTDASGTVVATAPLSPFADAHLRRLVDPDDLKIEELIACEA